ncbi:MAG TPA: 16S rRNA (cytosine(1402)-N(4))-methyltransferase RsmH [Acidimicrobiales bacterium]|nr:16S rRNA (cytosine(1402)-N(4))-methyltransferase RsmH [Acidimicrobiales bacterium]
MSRAFEHRPVMVEEIVSLMAPVPAGVVVDATLGGGGHARALLRAHPHIRLLGIDRDEAALEAAASTLDEHGDRVVGLEHARFDRIADVAERLGVRVSGVLFDLGVSSPQLDQAGRGFSYRLDAPLDMRMDRSTGRTAADVVNGATEHELARLIAESGERRFARRIAGRIVERRPLTTTVELAEVVRDAIPAAARRTGGHPARRVFQAVRIAVNDELDVLGPALDAAVALLVPHGRCVVLAYHSGEDRIVKERFARAASGGCVCPPTLPCVCGAEPLVKLLTRGSRKPSPAEVAANRRAESARLRVCERLP